MLFPFVYVLLGSSNDSGWAFNQPFKLIFGQNFIENISYLQNYHKLLRIIFNSFISSFLTALLSIVVVFSAAYAANKYEFRGKKILIPILAALVDIPEQSYLIGQLLVLNKLNLYSTMAGLIIPFIVNVRIFYYVHDACSFIPNELIDAGRVDGSNEFSIMTKISIPIILDKLLLAFFILFIAAWNNFLIPMIITNDSNLFTLPILISSLADDMRYNIGAVFMALLISTIPILLIYAGIQKTIFKNTIEL